MKITKNPNQIFTSAYCLWLLIHLYILFNSFNFNGDKDILYPFYKTNVSYNNFHDNSQTIYDVYDFSEFILYGLSPLFLWVSYVNLIDKK